MEILCIFMHYSHNKQGSDKTTKITMEVWCTEQNIMPMADLIRCCLRIIYYWYITVYLLCSCPQRRAAPNRMKIPQPLIINKEFWREMHYFHGKRLRPPLLAGTTHIPYRGCGRDLFSMVYLYLTREWD